MDHTTKATKIGTYSYMAPEVYQNKPYGASVDIYSLGLVMYWLLNERRLPFLPTPPAVPTAAQNNEAQMRRLGGEAISAPKNGSPALKTVVLKAIAFDPAERFSSPKEFLSALNSCAGVVEAEYDCIYISGEGTATENTWSKQSPQSQTRKLNTNEPSSAAKDYTTGEWSMKFPPPSRGKEAAREDSTRSTWDDPPTDVHWTQDDPSEEEEPHLPTAGPESGSSPVEEGPNTKKFAAMIEKKQRRSIRLWAVWLFCWTGGGLGVLLNAFPNPSTREIAAILLGIPLGVIPFFFKVKRILKESNHNPRVRKTLFTSLCVIGVLFLMGLLGALAEQKAQDSLSSPSSSANQEIAYTKGELIGNIYRNDWAGLLFNLPDGFENASEDYYALYEGVDNVECGLFLLSDSGEQIIICFEQLPYSQVTENIYLDNVIRGFADTDQAQDQGITMVTNGKDRQDFLIGAEKYTKAQVDWFYMDILQGTESVFVRKIDDRMCCIQIVGTNGTDNDNLAQLLGGIQRTGDGDNQISDGSAYTKGTLADGVYTNEWADLKLVVPEGFQNAPEEVFNAFAAQDGGECGLSIVEDGGQTCNLFFLDAPISLNDPKPFLEQSVEELTTQFSEQGLSAQWDSQYEEIQIAGNTYTGAHIAISANGVTAAESIYMRQLDSKLCCIMITGADQEANNALAAQFTSCRG